MRITVKRKGLDFEISYTCNDKYIQGVNCRFCFVSKNFTRWTYGKYYSTTKILNILELSNFTSKNIEHVQTK